MEREDLDLRLSFLKKWWDETENPLYIWETIAFSLAAEPPLPIPDWCLPYLAKAAGNVTHLAWEFSRSLRRAARKDFADLAKDGWDSVKKSLPAALEFAEERKKNVFSRQFDDAYAARASLDQQYGLQTGTKTTIKVRADGSVVESTTSPVVPTKDRIHQEQGIEPDRIARIIRKGKRLTGQR